MTKIDFGYGRLGDISGHRDIAVQDGLAIAHNGTALLCQQVSAGGDLPDILVPSQAVNELGDWVLSEAEDGSTAVFFYPKAKLSVTDSEAVIIPDLSDEQHRYPLGTGEFPAWLEAVPTVEGRIAITLDAEILNQIVSAMGSMGPVTLHIGGDREPILVTHSESQDRFGVLMPLARELPPLAENQAYQEALKRKGGGE